MYNFDYNILFGSGCRKLLEHVKSSVLFTDGSFNFKIPLLNFKWCLLNVQLRVKINY